jgi:shikimate dehydrogenase
MKKACVIGHPVSHSRSPLIHGYWLKKYGLQGSYESRDIHPDDLQHFLKSLPQSEYCGCNVTLPHKEQAASLVDEPSPTSKLLQSVNTVYVRDGKTCGTSTDGEGFYQNLLSEVPDFDAAGRSAFVLGAGGSASAIVGELVARGFQRIAISNRTFSRAQELQTKFGLPVVAVKTIDMHRELQNCHLLINTTSMGMNGANESRLSLEKVSASCIVADIVYVPLKTALILAAEARGLRTVPGLGMLLHQAVPGFELWFGVRPVVTPDLYDLVSQDINMPAEP